MTGLTGHPFETGLDKSSANFAPLTPVSFLARAAGSFGASLAVIDGERRITYADLFVRCRRLASALARRGIGRLDTVAILASNIPEMIEAHFAVPMLGAVLNPLNTRLDAATLAFSLRHGEAKVLIVDRDYAPLVAQVLALIEEPPLVVDVPGPGDETTIPGAVGYEALLAEGDPAYAWPRGPTTSGSRSASSTPRGPPATRRAPSTAIAAPISRRSATRSPSG
jgi:fatty-acyl-CoA synthase